MRIVAFITQSVVIDQIPRRFPRSGHATLKAQMTRSADSIAANIVEGCGAATQREFARFLDVAVKSSSQLQYHLIVARDRQVMRSSDVDSLSADTVHVRRMLYSLRKKVLADLS